jgi:hypothetical protein
VIAARNRSVEAPVDSRERNWVAAEALGAVRPGEEAATDAVVEEADLAEEAALDHLGLGSP